MTIAIIITKNSRLIANGINAKNNIKNFSVQPNRPEIGNLDFGEKNKPQIKAKIIIAMTANSIFIGSVSGTL